MDQVPEKFHVVTTVNKEMLQGDHSLNTGQK